MTLYIQSELLSELLFCSMKKSDEWLRPPRVPDLGVVRITDATSDGLSKIYKYLEKLDLLSKIKELDLSENNLTDLPPFLFQKMENLERINLSKNILKSLPSLSGLKSLKWICLDNNQLIDLSLEDSIFDELSLDPGSPSLNYNFELTADGAIRIVPGFLEPYPCLIAERIRTLSSSEKMILDNFGVLEQALKGFLLPSGFNFHLNEEEIKTLEEKIVSVKRNSLSEKLKEFKFEAKCRAGASQLRKSAENYACYLKQSIKIKVFPKKSDKGFYGEVTFMGETFGDESTTSHWSKFSAQGEAVRLMFERINTGNFLEKWFKTVLHPEWITYFPEDGEQIKLWHKEAEEARAIAADTKSVSVDVSEQPAPLPVLNSYTATATTAIAAGPAIRCNSEIIGLKSRSWLEKRTN